MPRSRYWKLTTDEVKKLTYNPDKVLNEFVRVSKKDSLIFIVTTGKSY